MQRKIKNYLKIGILLFGIGLFFNSCLKDENHLIERETKFFKIQYFTPFSKIKNNKIIKKSTKKFLTETFSKTNSENGFIIDTTSVQILISDYYTNYTFVVNMNSVDDSFLNNYVLTIFNDSIYHQMLISYPIIINGDEINYDTENSIAEEIVGNMLIQKDFCDGYETTEWVETEIEHNCTAGGDHSPGQSCSGEPWQQPWTEVSGSWVTTCHPMISAGPSSEGGGDGSGGGANADNGTPNNLGDGDGNLIIGTTPFKGKGSEEIGRKRECRKIKKILDDYPIFMNKVRDLKNKDSLTFETSVAVFNDNSIGEYQGVANNSIIQTLPIEPLSDYVSMAHVHNETTNIKSYSVPSLGDLQWIARRYKDGYLNTSKFTAFLATADGTYFALTINNPTKLWEFFRYIDAGNFNITLEERLDAGNKLAEVYTPILEKYYQHPTNALIKENAQGVNNNEQQLIYFLQFLEEADAGISVFESDENFNTFTKLSINGFNIDRTAMPCLL